MALLLVKKLKMTQIWKDKKVIPVTVLKAEPNVVGLVRTKEKDGYTAAQITLGTHRREERLAHDAKPKSGDAVQTSIFKEGDIVRASGTSKGRGFQGVVKRHGFAGGPKTHGQKNRFRAPGSIGSTAFQRVVPGRRMAGRMGNDRVTIKNLEIVRVDAERNLLYVKGAVPGATGGLIEVCK